MAPIAALVTADELPALIDPRLEVAVFDNVRAARDYEDRIRRYAPGLAEYWSTAASFMGEQ